ncbi:hypothetical protein [Massilia sp. TN1-12]|uniref:hypothetical protein n=1 Tax=Massilia paldalensis TaxID=3377675 RepID=UPI0038514453
MGPGRDRRATVTTNVKLLVAANKENKHSRVIRDDSRKDWRCQIHHGASHIPAENTFCAILHQKPHISMRQANLLRFFVHFGAAMHHKHTFSVLFGACVVSMYPMTYVLLTP